jgi:hypothetical protein
MLDNISILDDRLLKRRCVECGYDGALLRDGFAERCARCGCDLRRRPARSYAEMEGLLARPVTIDPLIPGALLGEWTGNVIHRWLAVLFLFLLFATLTGFLAAAALPV